MYCTRASNFAEFAICVGPTFNELVDTELGLFVVLAELGVVYVVRDVIDFATCSTLGLANELLSMVISELNWIAVLETVDHATAESDE